MNIGTNFSVLAAANEFSIYNKGTITGTSEVLRYLVAGIFNEGTIEARGGEFIVQPYFNLIKHFNPVFNVEQGGTLRLNSSQTAEGSITGNIEGVLDWYSGPMKIEDGKTATNNLTGNGINFNFGSIQGPGTFVNNSILKIYGGGGSKQFRDLNFENNGTILIDEEGANTNFNVYTSTLNNNQSGQIILNGLTQIDSTEFTINNYGIIKNNVAQNQNFNCDLNNYGQIISPLGNFQIPNGRLALNHETGNIKGNSYDMPSSFVNNGILAPDANGITNMDFTIWYQTFNQSATGKIELEINNLNDFDTFHLDASPNSNISGNLNILLNFHPTIGDEFPVITSLRTMVNQLPETISAVFEGISYNFQTELRNGDKELVLKLGSMGIDEMEWSQVSVYPNPTKDFVNLSFDKIQQNVNIEIYNAVG